MFSEELVNESDEIRLIETDQIVEQASQGTEIGQAAALLTLINNQIAHERKRLRKNDSIARNKYEWYIVAIVLDRLCLFGYTVIGLFGLFVILI